MIRDIFLSVLFTRKGNSFRSNAVEDMKPTFANAKGLMLRDNSLREAQKKVVALPERDGLMERVSEALRRTQEYYIDQQHPDGYWWYELESNVTISAEYIMFFHFLGLKDENRVKKLANHILKNQRSDGTWALYYGGKGEISTTVEAYFALKLAGFSADDEPLRKAREFILAEGGLEASRVFTKIYLALFGQFDWKAIPSIPLELNLMPTWFPINIYNFSSWARSTVVPLSIILEFKPVKTPPEGAGVRELYKEPGKTPPITTDKLSAFSWKKIFLLFDRTLKTMDHLPLRPLKGRALRKTERWILEHQDPSGDWGGIQPAMINSLLALVAMGYGVTSEPVKKGLEALERFEIDKGSELVLQSCISPVWDAALASLALVHSGMDRNHPALLKACEWIASKQIFRKGDWSVKKPKLEPGGWAFEFENNWYPDVDDSAAVLLFLTGYGDNEFMKPGNLEKGLRWILGMQGKDGGWAAFDVDNNMKILNQLPFGDLEAMIDPSTADLTGRVLELLGASGYKLSDPIVRRAIKFVKKTQEEDGSWWGRWGVNYLYGTSTVLAGLSSIGEDMSSPYVRKAVSWLKENQNPDGGWGESCESYEKKSGRRFMDSTASQTAWALLALTAAGEAHCEEAVRGVNYLLDTQKPDGTWDEEEFTGTGFPKYFFIRYHNYRNCFPLMALGKFLNGSADEGRR